MSQWVDSCSCWRLSLLVLRLTALVELHVCVAAGCCQLFSLVVYTTAALAQYAFKGL